MKTSIQYRFALMMSVLVASVVFVGAGCQQTTEPVNTAADSATIEVEFEEEGDLVELIEVTLGVRLPEGAATADGLAGVVTTSVDIPVDSTALAVMNAAVEDGTLAFTTVDSDFGSYVDSIHGVESDDTHFWGFYVNGAVATVGVSAYTVADGDIIEWRYEEIQ